jgi:anaerobic sulfite reductase subunit B
MTTTTAGSITDAGPGPLTPTRYRVVDRRRETSDVVTLALEPHDDPIPPSRPGQFNMLTAFGVGEVAISVSGTAPTGTGGNPDRIEHSVRAVGAVTHALCSSPVGALVGVRGPFGTGWDIERFEGRDVVVVAGGIGLAPLRGATDGLVKGLHGLGGPRRVFLLTGARTPDQVMYNDDLRRWRESGAQVEVTVDSAGPGWSGHVGVVTELLPDAPFEPARAAALVCGPEVMMRFTLRALIDRGVDPRSIDLSLERNMQCGVGLCGHCQLGPLMLCKDGPVVPYAGRVAELLMERER